MTTRKHGNDFLLGVDGKVPYKNGSPRLWRVCVTLGTSPETTLPPTISSCDFSLVVASDVGIAGDKKIHLPKPGWTSCWQETWGKHELTVAYPGQALTSRAFPPSRLLMPIYPGVS